MKRKRNLCGSVNLSNKKIKIDTTSSNEVYNPDVSVMIDTH